MKRKPVSGEPVPQLAKGEYVICAYAQRCSGPGWANNPVWVVVGGPGGLRQVCLQPENFTAAIHALYSTAHAAHVELSAEVERVLNRGRSK